MPLVTSTTDNPELVTVEEAKQHLRILAEGFDEEVQQKLVAARENCELWMGRTLTAPKLRTWSMDQWWEGALKLPYPPFFTDDAHELAVKYYDDEDADQTLDAENYHVIQSDNFAYIEWSEDADLPDIFVRPDAVRVEFYTGWSTLPDRYRVAILMELTRLWGDEKGRDLNYADRTATALKNSLDTGTYV
jgi:uncharacterized phiE125 gp8 family phage protein